MTPNIGRLDQIARALLGMALVAAAATNMIGGWGYFGIIPLLTAGFRFCPAYRVFGISTCRVRRAGR